MQDKRVALRSFKELIVWQRAIELAQLVYELTRKLPAEEQFGLKSQMQRAAVSISSNIAEGHGRNSRKEFVQFLAIARGSATELESQLIITGNIYKVDTNRLAAVLGEVQKMLGAMSRTLANR